MVEETLVITSEDADHLLLALKIAIAEAGDDRNGNLQRLIDLIERTFVNTREA